VSAKRCQDFHVLTQIGGKSAVSLRFVPAESTLIRISIARWLNLL